MACAHNTITGILLLCGPAQLVRSYMPDYTLVLYYRTRTAMVQLPMRVLHGICYSSPTVVRISHLMWLTKARLW